MGHSGLRGWMHLISLHEMLCEHLLAMSSSRTVRVSRTSSQEQSDLC
jgi:hypothetical protein